MKNLIVSLILLFFISPFIYSQSAEQDCEKGNYMLSLGKFGTAVQYFNKALSEKSDYAEAYFGMGKAYDSLGEFEEAIKDYSKAIESYPKYANAYYRRGIDKEKLGDHEGAKLDLLKAYDAKASQSVHIFSQVFSA